MKAKIQGIEVEGTQEEITKLIIELNNSNKKLSPIPTTHSAYEYYPPVFAPSPSTQPLNPLIWPQVWCGGYTNDGLTCNQNKNIEMYN